MNTNILFVQWRLLTLTLLGALLFISCVTFIRRGSDNLAYGVLRGVGDSQLEIAGPEKNRTEDQVNGETEVVLI